MEVILLKIKDIMSRDVASLNQDDSIERAACLMKEHDVGSIPVCNQNMVVGIVTDRDIALRSVAEDRDARNIKVREVMTTNPVTGNPEMDVHDAARIMGDMQIRRLPVVERNNLVGMVALGDISLKSTFQNEAGETLKNVSKTKGSY